MQHTTRAFLTALLFAALLPISSAAAQSATAALRQRHQAVNALLRQHPPDAVARQRRSERLTALLAELVDYQTLSQQALGTHWDERSAAERERFVTLLRQLVERNYETNLERILDFELSYGDERQAGQDTIVPTTARSRINRREPPLDIEYTMRRIDGAWRVIDVATDGVSLVANYRSQFRRIIERDGWNELIARMEHRLQHSEDT